jgi:hypothetical protein
MALTLADLQAGLFAETPAASFAGSPEDHLERLFDAIRTSLSDGGGRDAILSQIQAFPAGRVCLSVVVMPGQ